MDNETFKKIKGQGIILWTGGAESLSDKEEGGNVFFSEAKVSTFLIAKGDQNLPHRYPQPQYS